MLPIALALLVAVGTGRATFRAIKRFKQLSPDYFAITRNNEVKQNRTRTETAFLHGGFQDKMTFNEALQILDLHPGATKAEIIQRHKQIMLENHPDRGGSNYFASKINEAKDMLTR